MLLRFNDEIIEGIPKYNITDNIDGTKNIELANNIIKEGTPLNRTTFDNLQGDIYSSNQYVTLVADKIETELDLSKISSYSTPPVGNTMYEVAYGNGIWIAVGSGGKIMKSTDNKTWVLKTSGTTEEFRNVLYDGTQFVAVTYKYGYVYASTNGETWTRKSGIGSSSVYVRDFDYKDGIYVSVDDAKRIMTSTDLVTWTSRVTDTNSSILSVTHNDNCFIAVGVAGIVYKSTNGTDWTSQTAVAGNENLSLVKWVNDRFIAHSSGKLYYSTNEGTSWTTATKEIISGNVNNIYHDGIKYIASSSKGFIYSYNGSDWEEIVVLNTNENQTYSYFYDGNIFAFVNSPTATFRRYITTKSYKAYFKLSIPLSSYVTNKILRVKTVSNGGKDDFSGANYLNVNNLGEKPINSIFKSNEYLDLIYTENGWNVIGPRFSYGELSISSTGTKYINLGFNAKAVFVYCHRTGFASNDGYSMGFIPLKLNTETLLEVYANGPIKIYGILESNNRLTIKADSVNSSCIVNYFAIAW